jgi:hypothetical protein
MEIEMAEITIKLPEDRLEALKKLSADLGISAEELARLTIEELIAEPAPDLDRFVERILDKNRDLYQRLAS